jgi:hypothetical protein
VKCTFDIKPYRRLWCEGSNRRFSACPEYHGEPEKGRINFAHLVLVKTTVDVSVVVHA